MSDTTLIYLIRHGETASNVEGKFRGRADIPLSENGIRQSRTLAKELRDVPFVAIYSSPLKRSIQTAEELSRGRKLDIVRHDKFQNIDLGEWTDRPRAEIEKEYPELWRRWITEPEEMTLPGGESVIDVQNRCREGIIETIEAHRGEKFAIVSHRAVLKPLIAAILEIKKPFFWKIHLDTAGYTVVKYNERNGFMLMHLNIVHHIENLSVEKV